MRNICATSPRILYRRLLKVYCVISAMVCTFYLFSATTVPNEKLSSNRRLLLNLTKNANVEPARTVVRNTMIQAPGSTIHDIGGIKMSADIMDYSLGSETFEVVEGNSANMDRDNTNGGNTSVSKDKIIKDSGRNKSKEGLLPNNWKLILQKQLSLYDHSVVKFIQSVQVGYLSALAVPSLNSQEWNEIVLNGWQRRKYENVSLYCCISSHYSFKVMPLKRREDWKTPDIKVLLAMRFICPNPWKGDASILPNRVGLSTSPLCLDAQYINVEYPKRPERSDAIAFCGKIVYGDFPAGRLIEWFELNKLMGVDHVSLFTYNLTMKALKVLEHYHQEGYLTMKEFDFPLKAVFPRHIGQKYLIAWVDEQVTVYDCISRFREYKFVGILDVDEFMIPKHAVDNSYDILLRRLLTTYPRAAGFTFQTQLFISDWGQTNPDSTMAITKYRNRTKAMWDRRKSIFLTDRVKPQSVWTHGFNGVKPYNRLYISSTIASVFHYRNCRPQWMKKGVCLKGSKRFTDNTMQRYASKIERIVEKKKSLLLT